MRIAVTAAIVCLSVVGLSTASDVEAAIKSTTDIPAQGLGPALQTLAKDRGFELLYLSDIVDPLHTKGASGDLTTNEALTLLLNGTGLTYRYLDEKTVTIVSVAEQTSSFPIKAQDLSDAVGERDYPETPDPGTAKKGWFDRFRLAQADTSGSEEKKVGQAEARPSSTDDTVELGEVIVTGTHIRGVESAGSNLIVIDRDYLDKSGYATVKEIMSTLPQSFSGAVNERFQTDSTAVNINFGAAIDLRGLGASATLVLINGRRPAPGGFNAAFVDVSNIPASAIERIEVLPDGASAIYGSDAISGVVNIILRKDYDGAETRVRYGTFSGDADEYQASQLFGRSWNGGNALAGYQYSKRDALAMTDRDFSADSDQRSRGGDNFSSFLSNPGNIISPFTGEPAFAIPGGQDGTALAVSDLLPGVTNLQNSAEHNNLLPEQEMHSAFFNLSQDLGARLHLFAEGRYNARDVALSGGGFETFLFVPASNAFFFGDPFGFGFPFVFVGYNFFDDLGPIVSSGESESYGGVLGATFDLGNAWQITLAGSYAKEKNRSDSPGIDFAALGQALADPDPATAFNPFGVGSNTNPATLDGIRGTSRQRSAADLWNADIKVDGSLFRLAGGMAKLAIGADRREENFDRDVINHEVGGADVSVGRGRMVSALFAELALPFVGQDNAMPGVRRMDVSLAGRYEDYSDFGTTFNPKLGLRWTPVESLTLRGTWGTSFKAPRLAELDESTNVAILFPVADPQSPSGSSSALVLVGNNENLQEETATTWTAGFDVSPATVPGLTLSLTYYDIDFVDRIITPGPVNFTNILLEEDRWTEVINRNPSQAEVDAICNSDFFLGTPESCTFSPPAVILDVRKRNLASTKVRGLDLNVKQTFDTTYGVFNVGLNGSYNFSFEQAASDASPRFDVANTLNNPLALRFRGSLSWSRGGWGVTTTINYADSYQDARSQPNRPIDSWTTVDQQVSYRTAAGDDMLDNLSLVLSAVNVFDKDPPFVNQSIGYDPANANPFGRLISLQITKGW